jgi:NAD(P)-dependent dehydrogenase (short-subunit alcohol dehydrogenase family)
MNILILGNQTSLGSHFAGYAAQKGHAVFGISSLEEFEWEKGKNRPFAAIVNCLGSNRLDSIGDTPLHGREEMLVGNVMPIYWLIDRLVADKHPPARVLSVASQTYRIPQTNTAIYCASKAALVQLSRTMARELAQSGWVINCLAPGKIADTVMARRTDQQVLELRGWTREEADEYAIRNVPMRRFTDCEEVSEAMLKILDLPAYITGTCIDMTGGA